MVSSGHLPPHTVGGAAQHHTVVRDLDIGVMIKPFRDLGDPGHGGESLSEVRELQLAFDGSTLLTPLRHATTLGAACGGAGFALRP